MNRQLLLLIPFLFTLTCCKDKKDKIIAIDYCETKSICNVDGTPKDSLSKYFPAQLFIDSIPCILDGENLFKLNYFGSKKDYAARFGKSFESLKDTFQMVEDTFLLKIKSYTLFKMQEPILYNHYLDRKVYRMTSLRAFNPPIVVRIEKNNDSIIIIFKKLNKNIRYPFMVYGGSDSLFYMTPDIGFYDTLSKKMKIINKVKYDKQLKENKRINDSLSSIYNVIDYHLKLNKRKAISVTQWDSLEKMIDSANFWRTKPNVALDYPQIDGSRWILEGHSKNGYQIKIIPSPNFEKEIYKNTFDSTDNYARIFKYFMKITNLEHEPMY